MSDAEKNELTIDATGLSADQLSNQLMGIGADGKVQIHGVSRILSGVLAALSQPLELVFAEDIGPYAFIATQQAAIEVMGNAGRGCGHSLQSGSILIRSDASDYLAAYAAGGYVAVHGRAGDYVGYGLAGADIVVRSRCGQGAGANMRSGTLVLGNGCGENLGYGMTGGTIYVRGEISSVAEHLQLGRLKEADTIRLSLLLARAGLKTTVEKFQVFRPKGNRGMSL